MNDAASDSVDCAVDSTPDDWAAHKLENVLTRLIDYRGKPPPKADAGVPLITAKNVRFGFINPHPKEYIARDDFSSWMRRGIPKPGDILFTTEAPLGNVAEVPDYQIALGQRTVTLCPDQSIVSKKFLKQLLLSEPAQRLFLKNGTGGTVIGIKQRTLRGLEFAFPPLPEQKKIAAILTSVDEVIEKTEAQIAKLKDLKTAMMQELLTNGIGHTDFKDSPVGRIPASWEALPLAAVTDLQVGFAFKSNDFQAEGIRLLRGDNVGYGKPTWQRTKCIAYEAAVMFKKYDLCAGDIIIGMDRTFTKSGTKISLVNKEDLPCLLVQRVGRFVPTLFDRDFLVQVLRSPTFLNALKVEEKGMDIPHLSKTEILSPVVILPPIEEQQAIAQKLSAMDRTIEEKTKLLKVTNRLKKALMQDLLTGNVRVTP